MEAHESRAIDGLHVVEQDSYPEAVPGQELRNSLARRSSLTSPEPYAPHAQGLIPLRDQKRVDGTHGDYPGDEHGHEVQHAGSTLLHQYSPGESEKKQLHVQDRARAPKICGLSRKLFLWITILFILVIIIAAVLGGVLSSTLKDNNRGASDGDINLAEFIMEDKTGLAILNSKSAVYAYWLSQGGTVVEAEYTNGAWSKNRAQVPQNTMKVGTSAQDGSPIASVSYALQGTEYRQIFYFNDKGIVETVNTTAGGSWSAPYEIITSQSSQPRTKSLCACAATNPNGLYGIRVYFGSSNGGIQEIGMDFPSSGALPAWKVWMHFDGSDPAAGVSCNIINGNQNRLYLRNSTTTRLQQWTWDYVSETRWTIGANSTVANGVLRGGTIATTTDGQNTDYVFYQNSAGRTVHALYTKPDTKINLQGTNLPSIEEAPSGYAMAAAWSDNKGAVVMNQNSTSPTQLLFAQVTRNGQVTASETETGVKG